MNTLRLIAVLIVIVNISCRFNLKSKSSGLVEKLDGHINFTSNYDNYRNISNEKCRYYDNKVYCSDSVLTENLEVIKRHQFTYYSTFFEGCNYSVVILHPPKNNEYGHIVKTDTLNGKASVIGVINYESVSNGQYYYGQISSEYFYIMGLKDSRPHIFIYNFSNVHTPLLVLPKEGIDVVAEKWAFGKA